MTLRRWLPFIVISLMLGTTGASAQVAPALDRELARLPRLSTILYVTAHPDDESAAVLTYLARGLNARVVLISMTRGEGGQNSEGSEIGEELGWVRQRELEAAGAAYGVEVRILGASDFGYSKRVEETLERWDADALVGELCHQIRTLQPVTIISAWTGTPADGSSHHQTAGMLARRAFEAAGDGDAYPGQLAEGLLPWATPYFLVRDWSDDPEGATFSVPVGEIVPGTGKSYEDIGWEGFRNHRSQGMGNINLTGQRMNRIRRYIHRVAATSGDLPAPTSIEQIAPTLRQLVELFPLFTEWETGGGPEADEEEGAEAESDAGTETEAEVEIETAGQVEPGKGRKAIWKEKLAEVEVRAQDARAMAGTNPGGAVRLLIEAAGLLNELRFSDEVEITPEQGRAESWLRDKQRAFLHAAAAVAGLDLRAVADSAVVAPGESLEVRLAVAVGNRAIFDAAGFRILKIEVEAPEGWKVERLDEGGGDSGNESGYQVTVPEETDPASVPAPALYARAEFRAGELQFEMREPVVGVWTEPRVDRAVAFIESFDLRKLDLRKFDPRILDPRRLLHLGHHHDDEEQIPLAFEPVRVVPPLTVEVQPRLRLTPAKGGGTDAEFLVDVQAHRPFGKAAAWFDVPPGWYSPVPQRAEFAEAGRIARRRFAFDYPESPKPGRYKIKVTAGRGLEKYRKGLRRIGRGPSAGGGKLPPLYLSRDADVEVQVVDVEVPGDLRVGYIGFSDDPVPGMLEDLGVRVTQLDEVELAFGRLRDYSTIVIANRVYDSRSDLAEFHDRLMDYVREGGVLLVEHQGRRWDLDKFAPFPGKKPGRPHLRVTDETAAVKMLNAAHPVLQFPNKITSEDWNGWVQERGLYFWQEWSEQYTPLLEMADPGEEPLRGSLLYAKVGQGAYIYCGLALFRQVRAGVPGGVRLYINLLSQGVPRGSRSSR